MHVHIGLLLLRSKVKISLELTYSPDLNPIDARKRLHHPENTQQLKQMLIEEWVLLPQEMLHQLVLSMRRRVLEANRLAVWIPGHYNTTVKEFADHLAKKGASIQQITRKVVPFTSAKRIIKKKLNNLSSRQHAERNSNKIWWNSLKDLPMWPGSKAVAQFCLTTRHDCLLKHLYRIHVAQASFRTLCDFREDMDADHICRYPALKGTSLCDLYWQARDLLGS
ncbi:hypothetical protein TNCV_1228961 [Trichonephila clavipes]|nr:hypothetical protein TNCV_1228961 [Trichonephila clavipes]